MWQIWEDQPRPASGVFSDLTSCDYYHFTRTRPHGPAVFPSSVRCVCNFRAEEATEHHQVSEPLFTLTDTLLPRWTDSLSATHNTTQTPQLLWSAEKASRSSSLFHSLFSPSFQSRESISYTHAHAFMSAHTHTRTRLTSLPFHLSIQQPVII